MTHYSDVDGGGKSSTSLQHLPDNAHKRPILQRRRNPLFIRKLLIHFLRCAMRAFFDAHINPEPRGKGLLQSYADTESDDGR